jgi:uncharacterized protein with HEPN domain
MTGRNNRELLCDILAEITTISRLTGQSSYEEFYRDERMYADITRCIHTIGEIERAIPTIVRVKYALVPWKELAMLEDTIALTEPVLRPRLVWKISTETLPRIRLLVENLVDEMKK